MHQLLWLETLLKLAGGMALLIAPVTLIKLLGLPPSPTGFWPRLLGGVLVALAAATFIEGAWEGSRGLGLVGLVILNITGAAVLAVAAVFGGGTQTRRGSVVLWVLVALLFALALTEIAFA